MTTEEEVLAAHKLNFALALRITELEGENITLRSELWSRHGHTGPALYGDDGKMQCKVCFLDYATDPIEKIVDRLVFLDRQKYHHGRPIEDGSPHDL